MWSIGPCEKLKNREKAYYAETVPLKIFKHAQDGQFFAAFGVNAFHCIPSQSAAGSTGVVHI